MIDATYDEKLYRQTSRKFDKQTGKPIKHSRWVKRSGLPRYSKAQQKQIGEQFCEPQGWYKGARVRDA